MSAQDLLDRVKAQTNTGTFDWKQVREDIHDEFDKPQTNNEKDLLLALFHLTMDAIERQATLTPDELAAFKKTRGEDYSLLLVKESLIGENVSPELLEAATSREIAAGRMGQDHGLRKAALEGMAAPHETKEEMLMQAMVKHANDVMALQGPRVEEAKFDFMPQFLHQAIELFVFGAILRFGERYECSIPQKDRAVIALIRHLMNQGISEKDAKDRAWSTHQMSTRPSGDHPIAVAGFEGALVEGKLAQVLGQFRAIPEVSGAPYRMLDRAKPISLILGVAACAVALLVGQNLFAALGIGVVVGGASIAIARVLYSQMIKTK
jgi:hypothetical protein